jgi:hypothetical protein
MKIALLSTKIASWSLLLVGIGHTTTYLTTPNTAAQDEIVRQMETFTFELLGTDANIFYFYEGFSLMMGLLLFGYGALNLFMLTNNKEGSLHNKVLILNFIISLTSVILSVKYFFIVPVVFTSIALFGFSIALITKNKQA